MVPGMIGWLGAGLGRMHAMPEIVQTRSPPSRRRFDVRTKRLAWTGDDPIVNWQTRSWRDAR
jgi:hypothetical protein